MKRRDFIVSASSALLLIALGWPTHAQSRFKKARIKKKYHSGTKKNYSYKKVKDPTGAIGGRVERFELRGGDCSQNNDCRARPLNGRMVTRARTERVLQTNLKSGDSGLFRYSVLLPSSEYNIVDQFGTTLGQLLSGFYRGKDYDSFPLFSFDTDRGTRQTRTYAALSEMRQQENERVRTDEYTIGNLRRGMLDRWINVQVRFGLSTERDGYLTVVVDGRKLGTFRGRTMIDRGFLEVRYGIYQTGTNQYPGGPKRVPPQVAYFSRLEIFKAV